MDKWNGFGGKVEEGETVEEAALRELREEAGIEVSNLERAGIIDCMFVGDPMHREIYVFRASGVIGEPFETDEMKPQWFLEKDIPYSDMWIEDQMWYPYFLAGKLFHGKFLYEGQDKIIEHELIEIEPDVLAHYGQNA